ncbi:uncharacterized protein LOC119459879 isoform X3 [Dermacentor silvarum]|uniref:uncharacterized protein LOC119459879 isoform X3 n=1 Tax=Dermacentor silvarum TaxID=543639 RepID=UPI0021012251|nr:uncharacterized protein LOC119459879 isoform X3 [Dermacentor silvarum]XP_049522451.1 uncharacterized protein LOC119459879 isoform X3 [Dermacentor silvarum]
MCPFGAQSWIRFFSLQEPAVRFWMSECRHRVPLQQLCWVELLTRRARASRLMWAKTQCLRNMLSVAMSHFMDTHGLYCAIHVSRWQVAVHMEEIIAIGSSRLLGNARTQRLRTFLSVAVSPFMDTTKSAASRRQLQAQPGPSSDQHCPTDALTSGSSSMDSFADIRHDEGEQQKNDWWDSDAAMRVADNALTLSISSPENPGISRAKPTCLCTIGMKRHEKRSFLGPAETTEANEPAVRF